MSTLFRSFRIGADNKKKPKKSRNQRTGSSLKTFPSLVSLIEEVEPTPESIEEVLKSKKLRVKFRKFLTERVAIECLNFYEAIEVFERVDSQHGRNKAGLHMVEEYVKENSRYNANLGSALRCHLESLTEFTPLAFHGAKQAMVSLMQSNFFHEFRKQISDSSIKLEKPSLAIQSREIYRSGSFEELSEHLIDSGTFKPVREEDEEDSVFGSFRGSQGGSVRTFAEAETRRTSSQRGSNRRSISKRTGISLEHRRPSRIIRLTRRGSRARRSKQKSSGVSEVITDPIQLPSHLDGKVWKEVIDLTSTL